MASRLPASTICATRTRVWATRTARLERLRAGPRSQYRSECGVAEAIPECAVPSRPAADARVRSMGVCAHAPSRAFAEHPIVMPHLKVGHTHRTSDSNTNRPPSNKKWTRLSLKRPPSGADRPDRHRPLRGGVKVQHAVNSASVQPVAVGWTSVRGPRVCPRSPTDRLHESPQSAPHRANRQSTARASARAHGRACLATGHADTDCINRPSDVSPAACSAEAIRVPPNELGTPYGSTNA